MHYDYRKLNGRIVEKFKTRSKFAEAITLSERSLSNKLNNKVAWKQTEISKAMKLLDIEPSKIQDYFFTYKVHES